MKKFFNYLFVGMGVLFLLQLIALAYFYVVDPLNLKPLLFGNPDASKSTSTNSAQQSDSGSVNSEGQAEASASSQSNLTPEQERALQLVGIEPEAIPQSFTEAQLRCFVEILGQERVDEIKAGATPSMSEYYQAKDCV